MDQAQPVNPTQPETDFEQIRFPLPVPYYSQIADHQHTHTYLDLGKDLRDDPFWQHSGADTPAEYAHWALRSCGIAAIKSCIEAFGGPQRSIQAWIELALQLDGYLIQQEADGQTCEIGWKHQALAELCRQEGIPALPSQAQPADIIAALRQRQLVLASVSFEISSTRPVTRQGGHLVTLTGADVQAGSLQTVYLHNPSGRTPALQENAPIPASRFLAAFSGRIILIGPALESPSRLLKRCMINP